jgi:hypothetical protein
MSVPRFVKYPNPPALDIERGKYKKGKKLRD